MLSGLIQNGFSRTTIAAIRSQSAEFYELAKPRIALLVLVTTFVGMWVASNGTASLALIFFTLLGTGLASSASGALNNYIDREIDQRMARTRNRALPAGRMRPQHALWFAFILTITAFLILNYTVNALTAWLTMLTIFFYVVVYTVWLKRHSSLCTEIGGVAGALPPVIGWTAVTNEITWPAVLLFTLIFLWQPPHFWALALVRANEYKQANIPMLPVVSGVRSTKFRMLIYTAALLPATAAMYWLGLLGMPLLIASLGFGLVYLVLTIDFARKPVTVKSARRLFGFSILYLLGLFTLIFVDSQFNAMIT